MAKSKKTEKKENKITQITDRVRLGFETQIENLKTSGAALVWTVVGAFFLMIVICLAVFFSSVQGAEKVMVPDVVGKPLTTALLQLQSKELYAKIQLKYSDSPDDSGLVLAQTPDKGAIVKAYRRVVLTVSRGQALDSIADFTGKNFDETKNRINVLYSGETPLLTVAPAVFQKSDEPEGTIIAQYPYEDEPIVEPTKIYFVVSGGTENTFIKVPSFEGLTIKELLKTMESANLIYTFTEEEPDRKNKNATVISQSIKAKTEIEEYSHIDLTLAIGELKSDAENSVGIYTYEAPSYPFPVEMKLEAINTMGRHSTVAAFFHTGNKVTVPYDVEKGSTLKFYILDEEKDSLILD